MNRRKVVRSDWPNQCKDLLATPNLVMLHRRSNVRRFKAHPANSVRTNPQTLVEFRSPRIKNQIFLSRTPRNAGALQDTKRRDRYQISGGSGCGWRHEAGSTKSSNLEQCMMGSRRKPQRTKEKREKICGEKGKMPLQVAVCGWAQIYIYIHLRAKD